MLFSFVEYDLQCHETKFLELKLFIYIKEDMIGRKKHDREVCVIGTKLCLFKKNFYIINLSFIILLKKKQTPMSKNGSLVLLNIIYEINGSDDFHRDFQYILLSFTFVVIEQLCVAQSSFYLYIFHFCHTYAHVWFIFVHWL